MKLILKVTAAILFLLFCSCSKQDGNAKSSEKAKAPEKSILDKKTDSVAAPIEAGQVKIDPASGLKIAKGWEVVQANCTACHSARHFLRQKGSRQTWTEIIRWMQETQNLWQFDPNTEKVILDYLAGNYAPDGHYRRAPIPPRLMPKNPYATIPITPQVIKP